MVNDLVIDNSWSIGQSIVFIMKASSSASRHCFWLFEFLKIDSLNGWLCCSNTVLSWFEVFIFEISEYLNIWIYSDIQIFRKNSEILKYDSDIQIFRNTNSEIQNINHEFRKVWKNISSVKESLSEVWLNFEWLIVEEQLLSQDLENLKWQK